MITAPTAMASPAYRQRRPVGVLGRIFLRTLSTEILDGLKGEAAVGGVSRFIHFRSGTNTKGARNATVELTTAISSGVRRANAEQDTISLQAGSARA